MIPGWSTEKLLINIEEQQKEIDNLKEELALRTEQLSDEEKRCSDCVRLLKSLLHPEEFGWAVSQEVREVVKQTLIKTGEYYERERSEVEV